jgi:hypothetical protein
MTYILLCWQHSRTWPCPQQNDTSLTVFTAVHSLTISWDERHTYYSVHSSPLLDHVLSKMTHLLLCSQQSATWPCSEPNDIPVTLFTAFQQFDHVVNQMTHLLLCSQQFTTWPCPQQNYTSLTVFTTVHNLTMFWAKWHTCYTVHSLPTIWPRRQPNDTPITVFKTVHKLTMSSAKWHFHYCVHNSPIPEHVLSLIIHLLLCSQ